MLRKLISGIPRTFTKVNFYIPRSNYYFSSDNNQTLLLEEVESKVIDILKSAAKCDQSKLTKKASF